MHIHLVGLGVNGSILARALAWEGHTFSWNDSEVDGNPAPHTAWNASTGCIYPSGDNICNRNYELFPASASILGIKYETADYSFTQSSIPHKGVDAKFYVESELSTPQGRLAFMNRPSYHVNPQELVLSTRKLFAERYRATPPVWSQIIVTHGFHKAKPTDYRWGWSAAVTLKLRPELIMHTRNHKRICFNLKDGRFRPYYLYPKEGTNEYYFGTAFQYQKIPKSLDGRDKMEKLLEFLKGNPIASLADITAIPGTLREGWRPAYFLDTASPPFHTKDGVIYLRPQMANGIRHFPLYMEEILVHLRKIDGRKTGKKKPTEKSTLVIRKAKHANLRTPKGLQEF